MRVALANVEGDIGQSVVRTLLNSAILGDDDRLILIQCDSDGVHLPEYSDNYDVIDVASTDVLEADLVLVCPNPVHPVPGFYVPDLVRLADLLERSADTCKGAVLLASSPVELGVDVLSEFVNPQRVVGLGAYLDAWFWRQELATLLGVDCDRVKAVVGGMADWGYVPLVSTISVLGLSDVALAHRLESVGLSAHDERFFADWLRARKQIRGFLEVGQQDIARQRLDACSPGVAACIKPLFTDLCERDIAPALVDLIRVLKNGEHILMGVQCKQTWEQIGLDEALPLGQPCFVGAQGVIDVVDLPLSDLECAALRSASIRLKRLAADWFAVEDELEGAVSV